MTRRLAETIVATVWAVALLAAYLWLPTAAGWTEPGWWYGFGWIPAIVLWVMPVSIYAARD